MKKFRAPGYTQVPNAFFDEMMKDFSEAELKVLLKIIRNTFGWRKDRDKISCSQIIESTGLSKRSVVMATGSLEEKGIISVEGGQRKINTFTLLFEDDLVQNLHQSGELFAPDYVPSGAKSAPYQRKDIQRKKESVISLVNYWNSKSDLINHREDSVLMRIKERHYSIISDMGDELFQAIDNYSTIASNRETYFFHKWSLWDFILNAHKFTNAADPFNNYRNRKSIVHDDRSRARRILEEHGRKEISSEDNR